jgi:hypothetical protein
MPCRAWTIPASCVDLDLAAVERELVRTGGNVNAAARALGLYTRDLRLLIYARPELLDKALEAEALALDKAQAEIIKTIRGDGGEPLAVRLRAAVFLLRYTEAGRRRGFG